MSSVVESSVVESSAPRAALPLALALVMSCRPAPAPAPAPSPRSEPRAAPAAPSAEAPPPPRASPPTHPRYPEGLEEAALRLRNALPAVSDDGERVALDGDSSVTLSDGVTERVTVVRVVSARTDREIARISYDTVWRRGADGALWLDAPDALATVQRAAQMLADGRFVSMVRYDGWDGYGKASRGNGPAWWLVGGESLIIEIKGATITMQDGARVLERRRVGTWSPDPRCQRAAYAPLWWGNRERGVFAHTVCWAGEDARCIADVSAMDGHCAWHVLAVPAKRLRPHP